ncbi:MAG: hypothetical protein R3E53_18275 [Myxococcota bacterium]
MIAPKMALEVLPRSRAKASSRPTSPTATSSPTPSTLLRSFLEPPPGSEVTEEWSLHGLCRRMDLALTACYPIRAETGVLRESREAFAFDISRFTDRRGLRGPDERLACAPAEVKRHPHGHVFDDETILVGPTDPDCEDRLDVGNAEMLAELEAIRAEAWDGVRAREASEGRRFQLISRRLPNVYNSTGRDLPKLGEGSGTQPRLPPPRRPRSARPRPRRRRRDPLESRLDPRCRRARAGAAPGHGLDGPLLR